MGLVGNHGRTCMSKLTYFLFLTQHEPSATLGFECEMCLMGLMCLNMCFRLGVLFLRIFCVTLGQGLGGSPRSLGMSLGYKTCPHFLPEPFASWFTENKKALDDSSDPLHHAVYLLRWTASPEPQAWQILPPNIVSVGIPSHMKGYTYIHAQTYMLWDIILTGQRYATFVYVASV